MKRLLTICLLAVISLSATAQKHQTFKGVPIDGRTISFINHLKQKGFQQVGKSDTLIGTFAGYENCQVTALSSTQTGIVYGVKVMIPMCAPLLIYEEYKKLQIALTEKYGEPLNEKHDNTPSNDEDALSALYKMIASAKEQLAFPFNCVFDNGCGTITLNGGWFPPTDCGGGCILMQYIDNANNTARQRSAYDDL